MEWGQVFLYTILLTLLIFLLDLFVVGFRHHGQNWNTHKAIVDESKNQSKVGYEAIIAESHSSSKTTKIKKYSGQD